MLGASAYQAATTNPASNLKLTYWRTQSPEIYLQRSGYSPNKCSQYLIPWKSKTKQRMVFRMTHVKDSLLPKDKVWSLDFLDATRCSKTKTGDFQESLLDNAVCTHSRLHVEEIGHGHVMNTMKLLQAPYEMAVQTLAKVVKGKLKTMEMCLYVRAWHARTHICMIQRTS